MVSAWNAGGLQANATAFCPPSRIVAESESLEDKDPTAWDVPVDPAGQALCDNMRELTAHLRGIYHSLSHEDPDVDHQSSGHPLVALCDSMRELTAQLRGIFHSLKTEETDAEKDVKRTRHPLVASLAESLHREALRMLDDVPMKPAKGANEAHPPPSSGVLPSEKKLSPSCESRTATSRRTRPRPRGPGSPGSQARGARHETPTLRKRAASRESGPERLKRLGLVGIPPKDEASGQSGTRRLRRQPVEEGEAKRPVSAKRSPVQRASSKKGSGPGAVPETQKQSSEKLKASKNKATLGESLRPPEVRREAAGAAVAPAPQKRAASRESGSERLKRLGLVVLPPRKDEATATRDPKTPGAVAGTAPRRTSAAPRRSPVSEGGPAGNKRTPSKRAPVRPSSKKLQKGISAARGPADQPSAASGDARDGRDVRDVRHAVPSTCSKESEAMDEDVRRMLEWAAAEAKLSEKRAGEWADMRSSLGQKEFLQRELAQVVAVQARTLNRWLCKSLGVVVLASAHPKLLGSNPEYEGLVFLCFLDICRV
ncbi:Uncharacterized protein SCF082_LOCUS21587 [Durusdinium trenchii]|uniref:Uncharacterized protein n=1 Tax=Durusdinium trenchii TaxID=1381693 RepID=A0ABP0LAU0_9DINO